MNLSIKTTQRIALFLFFIISFIALSQEVNFQAKVSRENLALNERLRVVFSINTEADNFNFPSFDDFDIIMGPNPSVSYSFSSSGKREYSKSYTFILQPKRKGLATIGIASIEVDGKQYKTQPVSVKVTEAVKNPKNDTSNEVDIFSSFPNFFRQFNQQDDDNQQEIISDKIQKDDVFLIAQPSETNVYVNQLFSITYKLYFSEKIIIDNYSTISIPSYSGFEKEEIPIKNVTLENCTYNNKPYRCAILKRFILHPQKSGNLTIDPLSIAVDIAIPTQRIDFFGNIQYFRLEKQIQTQTHHIHVKDFPEQGKPDNFTGAVGNFDFETKISTNTVKSNETMNIKINVSGEGNLGLFQLPKPLFPSDWEVYTPDIKENITNSLSAKKGSIIATYTIVPPYAGKYPVNEISFSYFDPKKQSYITKKSEQKLIEVIGTPMPSINNKITDNQTSNNVDALRFLKLSSNLQSIKSSKWFKTPLFYILWLLPYILIPIFILIYKKIIKVDNTNISRSKEANKLAKKYFSNAKKSLKNKEQFYQSLELGIYNYFKAKLHIETTEFSKEKIIKILNRKNINQEDIFTFEKLISNCNIARYSPYTENDMQNDYQLTIDFISKLDRQIK